MKFFKKLFASKEVKAALGSLEEAAYEYQYSVFDTIRSEIEKFLLDNPEQFVQIIKNSGGRTPREWVYSQIGNIAGNMAESGQFHIYRGVLNPMGPGEDLIKIFDATYDELLKMNACKPEYAEKQKKMLREGIKNVG